MIIFTLIFLAIIKTRGHELREDTQLYQVVEKWNENPLINLAEEVSKYDIRLVYPILVTYKKSKKGYVDSIEKAVKYLNDEFSKFNYSLSFPFNIFYIFMPIDEVGEVKKAVIECITSKKQLK